MVSRFELLKGKRTMRIKRRTLASLRIWTLRISLTVIVCGALYLYGYSTFFTITSYDIQGVDQQAHDQIEHALYDASKKKTYGILPNDKIFTYSTARIVAVVRTYVSDAATVDIRPVGLHTVRIHVTLLTPLFRVSETEALTKDAIVFSTNKSITKYPHITIASSTKQATKINGLIFDVLTVDGKSVDVQFLDNLALLSSQVSSLIFQVANILVEATGDVSLMDASGKSKVMILQDVDQKKVWSTLVSALDTDPLKTKLATEREQLEYLDVRYGNKVFYRFSDMPFQNNGTAAILNSHATTSQGTSTTPH